MKFNKILALPALALTLLGLGACSDEVKYDPAQPDTNAEVFFASTTPTSVALDNDQNVIAIPIYRANSAGSVTVALSSSQTADGEPTTMFSVPGDVTFADGSDVAEVTVNLDFSNIKANTKYALTLTIDDAAATNYGKRTQTFTITYAPWSEWKVAKDYGEYTLAARYSGVSDVIIKERKNLLDDNQLQYMVVGADDKQYGKAGLFNNSFTINLNKETNAVSINPQDIGMPYEQTYKCYITDSYTFFTKVVNGPELDDPVDPEQYKNASKFNPETGMMTISAVYYVIMGNQIGWFGPADEFLQLPGYPDYNLYFANNGTSISEEGDIESAVITIAMGADVKGFAMKLVDGYLTDKQIDEVAKAIADDTEATVHATGGDFEFPIKSEGYKTLVCVTYNEKGEVIGTQHYTFYYEVQMIDWNEGWKSLGKVNYTDYFVYTKPQTWQVEMQESEDTPGYFRLVKPYATCPAVDPDDIERGHFYIYIDATNPNQASIELSATCNGYGVMSYSYYMLMTGKTDADVTAAGMWGTYKDGELTFPAKSLRLVVGSSMYVTNLEKATVIKPVKTDKPGEELSFNEPASSLKLNASVKPVAGKFAPGVSGNGVKAGKTDKKKIKFRTI